MHRTAIVHNKMATKVGFFFIPFGVELICFGKQFPIDVFGAFACIIDFMFGKFRRKSMKKALVKSGNKSFHNLLCKQLKVLKPSNFIDFLFYIQFESRS